MPRYPGGGGLSALTADLRREFRAASSAAGCAAPPFLVVVTLTVGPSGVVYDAKSVNNLPLITKAQAATGMQGVVATTRSLQPLPATCEMALVAAAHQLPRFRPGTQNGRRVAVSFTLKLVDGPR